MRLAQRTRESVKEGRVGGGSAWTRHDCGGCDEENGVRL